LSNFQINPMTSNVFNFIILSLAFLVLFAAGEIAYHVLKVKGETTRKLIHIGTGILTLTFPIFFTSVLWVALLCLSFLLILLASQRYNFLRSINDIDRKSHGSALYPIIVVLIFAFYDAYQFIQSPYFLIGNVAYFYLPILIMAIADPMAAVVGKKYPVGVYKIRKQQKSLSGSLAFFLTAIVICLSFIHVDYWWLILLISLSTTLVEGLSKNGFDNFSIPLAVAINLIVFS